ncbi:MAG: tetratricopeptide repeat protein [Bacteroidota bacterium]
MPKFNYLLTLFFILISCFAVSQNSRNVIDSLFKELNKAEDKNKIEILNKISRSYWDFSLDSSLYFANEALNLAHILNDKKGLSDAYNRIGNVYYFQNEYKIAEEFYHKALKTKKEINDLKGVSSLYNNLAILYDIKNEPEISLEYYYKALEISKKRKDNEDIASYLGALGNIYQRLNNYKKSIEYYIKAANITKDLDNEIALAQTYNALGNIYQEISSHDVALRYFLDALEIFKKLNNQRGISMIYNNLGIVYQNLKENDKALEYYKKSLEIDVKNEFNRGQASAYNNIGTAYDKKGDKTKALEYYTKALEINKKLNDQDGIAIALNNIGLVHLDLGEFNQAEDYLNRALEINNKKNDVVNIANVYNNLGKLYLKKGELNTAKSYLLNSIELAKPLNAKDLLVEAYDFMSDLHTKQNNYKKALEYYKLYSEMNDSIFTKESSNRVAELKIKHETENLETENDILKKDNEINLLELKRQKNQKKYLIAFSILIFTLAILSFSQFRLKKRTNNLLETKNNQLKQANQKLRISEQNLKELNATKDKFFSIIAHDLKNPFQSLLGFSEALYNNLDDLNKDEINEYTKLIFESSQNLFSLLGNLLEWSKSQLGSMKLSPEEINLSESLDDTLSLLKISAQRKLIRIESKIPEDTLVYADKNVLSTVLRNLVSNSIKFTDKHGKIDIESFDSGDKVTVKITDNGEGISQENLKKLFRIDHSYSTKGTDNESGTGLGLILCKELIIQSGGEIWVNSTPGVGSEFKFTLPKAKA